MSIETIERTSLVEVDQVESQLDVTSQLLNLDPRLAQWAREGLEYGVLQDLDPNTIHKLHAEFETAIHENGHVQAAKAVGWAIPVVSIVPGGNALGYTISLPKEQKPTAQLFLDKITICFGGLAAERAAGVTDHRGCGSDIATAQSLAEIVSELPSPWQAKAGTIISAQCNLAQKVINSANLRKSSWDLLSKKVIT